MKTFLLAAFLFIPLHAAEPFTVGSFTFQAAEPWIKAPAGPMVAAALTHGEAGPSLKFYHFGEGQGGGVNANLKRWQGQFEGEPEAKTETRKHGDQKVTVVTISGTYLDGPPMAQNKTPRPNFTLLGAIIPNPTGDVFLKMTGPNQEVADARENFLSLLDSAFAKQD